MSDYEPCRTGSSQAIWLAVLVSVLLVVGYMVVVGLALHTTR